MSEPILKALIQLFALISDVHIDTGISVRGKDIVRLFLTHHLNNELVIKYMEMFDEYVTLYHSDNIARGSLKDRKRTSLTAVRILAICETINEELQQKQKLYVIIQLLDFILFSAEITENELDFMETVSSAFNIPIEEYQNIKSFILKSISDTPGRNNVMIIDSMDKCDLEGVKHISKENLKGRIAFLHIHSTNSYILRYSGNEDLFLNGQNIFSGQTYIFDLGSTIRNPVLGTIYYNDINSVFTEEAFKIKISIDASDVSLKFKNSDNGIHNIHFHEESGTLVGILGGSGVGKTTLLNVLSGMSRPDTGDILINGFNLYSEKDRANLRGVIGFVPQDDLLIEELTVFQNLYYSARMCLDNLPEKKIAAVVDNVLTDMDLYDIRDLKVGNTLNKVISGGQRKRLNIALELIREPTILFADEPTSGLSSVDSEVVMNLLKEQTYRGKLVIINIHQPGSEIYKMFDKVMFIDKGGWQIYYGNPTEAIVYFKTLAGYSNAKEDQCITCGNVNADQLLQIVEAKVINEHGKPTRIRKVTPVEWADRFMDYTKKIRYKSYQGDRVLPENYYSIPGLLKQSGIFFIRDLLSKLANRQYVMISLFGSPLLALLLAYFTKYSGAGDYLFSENVNLPAYLFMCVITSLFLGLIISAEEIVKDRKILRRESFLNLSWFSYLNSKVMMMFLISAIQTISFILIGNYIMEIKGMTLSYWIVLFTTSCLANMMGLNISAAFNSVITIYILIPFVLIPQLLFSGVLVKFDWLRSHSAASYEYVPVIGDLMPSRWSFEALAVEQFKNNKFEKNFFRYEAEMSQNDWYSVFLINQCLKTDLWKCKNYREKSEDSTSVKECYYRLNHYIDRLNDLAGFGRITGQWKDSLNIKQFNAGTAAKTEHYLDSLAGHFRSIRKANKILNDSVEKSLGAVKYNELKEKYENSRLNALVLNEEAKQKSIVTPRKIIQKFEPVFMKPVTNYGRSQFYVPYKKIGNITFDTFWFNIIVLWVLTIILYVALYFNLFQKAGTFIGKIPLPLRKNNKTSLSGSASG
jgi:ABC transport system ATP-binding/permease protein